MTGTSGRCGPCPGCLATTQAWVGREEGASRAEGDSARQEIEFMYKPGNLSRPPPIVVPHQPRLDWQMWFAALGPHTHSPWFTSLVLRLLQGKEPGEAERRGGARGASGRPSGGPRGGRTLSRAPCALSDPPRPEPRAQLPLPPAAAHVRAGPALQVLVLAPLGAGVSLGAGRGAGSTSWPHLSPPAVAAFLSL